MPKIVLSHPLHEDMMVYLESKFEKIVITNGGTPKELLPELIDAQAVIIRIGFVDRETMEQCPELKVIGRPGVGYDNIDVRAAAEKGIKIVYTPGANSIAVAEHTLAMILSTAKNSVYMNEEMKLGNYGSRLKRMSIELYNKNVLIIGFGAIGRAVAQRVQAFGVNVYIYDPILSSEVVKEAGYQFVTDLDAILPEIDILTLHCPLTADTAGIIGEKEINLLKQNAIIVNCARGGLVDEKALYAALEEGRIYGAGIDMFEDEPTTTETKILYAKNMTSSPHTAGMTSEALLVSQKDCIDGVLAVLHNEPWKNIVSV